MTLQRTWLILPLVITLVACGGKYNTATIGNLKHKPHKFEEPQLSEAEEREIMTRYQQLLVTEGEKDSLYHGEAMRRLADLQLDVAEEEAMAEDPALTAQGQKGMQDAIELYNTYLDTYPTSSSNDLILYQLANAYSLTGQTEIALVTLDQLVKDHPDTRYLDEVQFRRGEILFVERRFRESEQAYGVIVNRFPDSIYYEKALYKYGWTQYKQNDHEQALNSFIKLLDGKQEQGMIAEDRLSPEIPRADQELLADTLRAISLSFANEEGAKSIKAYFTKAGTRSYEALIYRQLGALYLKQDRITDAAEVYLAFVSSNPESPYAPQLHTDAIDAYTKGGFPDLVLSAKEEFVKRYNVDTRFWTLQTEESQAQIQPLLTRHMSELATHYHAVARKSGKAKDYQRAAGWYDTYLRSFPDDKNAAQINFLLAETLFEAKQYPRAITEYEKTAYDYPAHKNSAEAGYAALLTYKALEKLLKGNELTSWQQKDINSALRFTEAFPQDKRTPAVLAKTAEELYALRDYSRASETAKRLLDRQDITDQKLRYTSWIVYGHSEFELGNYAASESAYRTVLKQTPKSDKQYIALSDRLAASIYKQGEQERDKGAYLAAADYFMRVGTAVPNSTLRATAQYDAATMFIQAGDWQQATRTLEDFRKRFPKEKKLQQGVTEKLAVAYTETGQAGKAAGEMLALAAVSTDPTYRRTMMLQAAQTYDKAGQKSKAVSTYKDYLKKYPKPAGQAVEAQHYLAEYYRTTNQPKQWAEWLNAIILTDSRAGSQRSARTRYLAADATLELAKPFNTAYQNARLTIPLKKSLKTKKRLMQDTIKLYERAMKYQVAEVTTEATYKLAEIYNDFSRSLMKSQRPKGLNAEELEQYDILLEEQAFPFEEKSIEIHIVNIDRAKQGLYDEWVKKSIEVLAKFQPIRYAKQEKTVSYVEATQ